MTRSVFTNALQIGLVVDDVDVYIKRYNDEYGIGPWSVHYFTEENMTDMAVNGEKVNYSMKAAFCQLSNIQLELIEPLDNKNIYTEFLKQKGPGLHHIAFGTNDHDEVVSKMEAKGNLKIQEGKLNGKTFTYLDTVKDLGFIAEIYKSPKDWQKPIPDKTYPVEK